MQKLVLIATVTLLFFGFPVFGRGANLTFARHFSDEIYTYSVRELSDGGYLLAGSKDIIPTIIRLDTTGNLRWARKLDPGPGFNGELNSAIESREGGFFAIGETFPINQSGLKSDPVILRLNTKGEILWKRSVPGEFTDRLTFVMQTSDGGYLLIGETASFAVAGGIDAWVLKLNKSGRLLWSKVFGREGEDRFFGAVETADGNYVLTGMVNVLGSTEPSKAIAVKVDTRGHVKWKKLYVASVPAFLEVYSVAGGLKDTFYIGGLYQSERDFTHRALIMRINWNGNIIWKRTFNRSDSDAVFSLSSAEGGSVIAGGETGVLEGLLMKMRSDGKAVWARKAGGIVLFTAEASQGYLTITQQNINRFQAMFIRSDSSGISQCKVLKRTSMQVGTAKIITKEADVTIEDVTIELGSPRIKSHRTTILMRDVCSNN